MSMLYEYVKCCYHSLPLAYLFSRTLTHINMPIVILTMEIDFKISGGGDKTIKEVIEVIILVLDMTIRKSRRGSFFFKK